MKEGQERKAVLEGFEAWWRREESSGIAIEGDTFAMAVLKVMSEAAYKAGARNMKRMCKLRG